MSKLFRTAVIASLATFAVGCASTAPKPFAALAKAEASIEQAKRADARRFDPANLDQAQQKLTAARADAQKRDSKSLDRSRRLAEQAELDAELASANATAAALISSTCVPYPARLSFSRVPKKVSACST